MSRMKPKTYTLKTFQDGKEVSSRRTNNSTRFFNFLKAINFIELKENNQIVYLKVDYGKHLNVWGEKRSFYNSGSYSTKKDLWRAFLGFHYN